MRKSYAMEELDCANCAAKMETAIGKIKGVERCSVNFFAQKLVLEVADDMSTEALTAILDQAQAAVRRVDGNCRILCK